MSAPSHTKSAKPQRSLEIPVRQPVFDNLVIIQNPASTHAAAGQLLATQLRQQFASAGCVTIITAQHNQPTLLEQLSDHAKHLGPHTLVAVGGGDGTVNQTVSALMSKKLPAAARRSVVLPLWGGNANDLACMLNGQPSKPAIRTILTKGRVVAIQPVKLKIRYADGRHVQRLATNYVSFGASAAAARAINRRDHRRSRLHRIPGGRLLRELATVTAAMVKTPRFSIAEGGDKQKIYERAIINGSRFAKVNYVTLELTTPHFLVATVQRKRPASLIYHMMRLAGKRYHDELASTATVFTVLDAVSAQIDGETLALPAGCNVSVKLANQPFYAFSTRLSSAG